jgi:hypothetical protein
LQRNFNSNITTNTFVLTPNLSTNYFIAPTGGCITSTVCSSISLTVVPSPTIAVLSNSICSGQTATLIASGASNYTWQPSGALTNSISVSPSSSSI